MKRLEISVLLAFVFSVLLSMTALNTECAEIRSSVLRMHVLANSDSEEDQALKLPVRQTNAHLQLLQEEAQKVVAFRGYDYRVSVALENSYFTTRTYGDVTLPAGNYQALRVVIGEGEGHNWWCVMFPPLCISAASEDEAQLSEVLTPQQMELVETDGYEVRFKCVELYEEFMKYLSEKSR